MFWEAQELGPDQSEISDELRRNSESQHGQSDIYFVQGVSL